MAKRTRIQLSRGWKTARNLAVFLLILIGIWAGFQLPWWMMEHELRQDAQEEFEILWKGGLEGHVYGSATVRSTYSSGVHTLIARVDDTVRAGTLANYEGNLHIRIGWDMPLENGKPEVYHMRELLDVVSNYDGNHWLFAAGLPEDAVKADLTVTAPDGAVYTSSGLRDMDIVWLPVTVPVDDAYTYIRDSVYELNLYDDQGKLLAQVSGPV